MSGRLDAHWADYVDKVLDKEVKAGHYIFIFDLSRLNYISSAGLGIFLRLKKKLELVNGSVVFTELSEFTKKIFKISNFHQLFQIYGSVSEAETAILDAAKSGSKKENAEFLEQNTANYLYQIMRQEPTALVIDGSIKKLSGAQYSEIDMVQKPLSDLNYAIGIGSLGDKYEEVKNTFGEMLVLNHNVFYLPTDGSEVPDFLITEQLESGVNVCTLFNVAFQGNFNLVVRFKAKDRGIGISLNDVYKSLFAICERMESFKGLIAIVLCAETVGLLGASLKKSPISENVSHDGLDILAKENLKEWLHFPAELHHKNKTICAVGLSLESENEANFSNTLIHSLFHVSNNKPDILSHNHGSIFDFMPLTPNSFDIEEEISKVIQNSKCVAVQHLLEKSKLYEGIVGICVINEPH